MLPPADKIAVLPAILYNIHGYVKEEILRLYIPLPFPQFHTQCKNISSNDTELLCSCCPAQTGPRLGCRSADWVALSLRPPTVCGSGGSPRGRRPQTEEVCRWRPSQRKRGGRWESTGRKATCRLVMRAERGFSEDVKGMAHEMRDISRFRLRY